MRAFREYDILALNSWLIRHDLDPLEKGELPKTGVIIDGVACGFISLNDTNVGFLECFVSNPEASSEARNAALDKITAWGLALLKAFGLKHAAVLASNESIILRASQVGFKFKSIQIGMLEL